MRCLSVPSGPDLVTVYLCSLFAGESSLQLPVLRSPRELDFAFVARCDPARRRERQAPAACALPTRVRRRLGASRTPDARSIVARARSPRPIATFTALARVSRDMMTPASLSDRLRGASWPLPLDLAQELQALYVDDGCT